MILAAAALAVVASGILLAGLAGLVAAEGRSNSETRIDSLI